MILKTYSRIFTSDVNATLAVLRQLVGREPELREPFQDMEVLTIGDFASSPVQRSRSYPLSGQWDRSLSMIWLQPRWP